MAFRNLELECEDLDSRDQIETNEFFPNPHILAPRSPNYSAGAAFFPSCTAVTRKRRSF